MTNTIRYGDVRRMKKNSKEGLATGPIREIKLCPGCSTPLENMKVERKHKCQEYDIVIRKEAEVIGMGEINQVQSSARNKEQIAYTHGTKEQKVVFSAQTNEPGVNGTQDLRAPVAVEKN